MTYTKTDLSGKTALVTGATSGIGKVTATALANMGASVYLICRNREKGQKLAENIKQSARHDRVHLIIADLGEQAQVRAAAEEFLNTGEHLHILHNNAGITNTSWRASADGIEETFAVNHLGYFLLTNLLLDRIKESAPARIVNVASHAHHFVKGMQFDDLEYKERYQTLKVYGQSKLANLLFALELDSRLENSGVTINSVHPGAVATGLGTQNGLLGKVVPLLLRPFFRTSEKGAESSIYACVSPKLAGTTGKYYYNCKEVRPKPWARDAEAAQQLWKTSEVMVGSNFPR
jgi:retinol dehydrogenase-12